jgi:tetratricopeptide (TPR) repeat protein
MRENDAQFESLEEERDFLLNSLRDLEKEHAAGDVDVDDYTTLRDGYIARAAAITREIEGTASVAVDDEHQPGKKWLKVLGAVTAVIAVAVAAGWWVADQSGQRLPGQSSSGGIEMSSSVRLSLARSLNFSDPAQAIQLYTDVLKIEPDNVETLTYRSWLLTLSASGASDDVRDAAYATAIDDLLRAVELDPTYPDSQCFIGIVYFRILDDPNTAEPYLTTCRSLNPPHEVMSYVTAIVDQVQEETTNTTTPQ